MANSLLGFSSEAISIEFQQERNIKLIMQLHTSFLLGWRLSAVLALPMAESLFGINRVLYFLDNDAAGNSIVSVQISDQDGTLSSPVKTATGGKGLPQLAAVSQDSVVVSGNV